MDRQLQTARPRLALWIKWRLGKLLASGYSVRIEFRLRLPGLRWLWEWADRRVERWHEERT